VTFTYSIIRALIVCIYNIYYIYAIYSRLYTGVSGGIVNILGGGSMDYSE